MIISDIHSGCRLALCPPEGVRLDDGGTYKPSRLQRKLWKLWREFWDEFVPEATKGDPYAVVFNGDAIDGVHHGSTTQISHNLGDQRRIAEAVLRPVVASHPYFHIRGTEAHVGQSGVEEEELARDLGAIPNEEGQYARYELWFRLRGGGLVQCMHHVGTTSSNAYEATGLGKEMAEINTECARWGLEVPDVIVRSHRHRHIEVRLPAAGVTQIGVVTPCWQGKTPFAWKVSGARTSVPQFGGVVVRRAMSGKFPGDLYTRAYVKNPARSKVAR